MADSDEHACGGNVGARAIRGRRQHGDSDLAAIADHFKTALQAVFPP